MKMEQSKNRTVSRMHLMQHGTDVLASTPAMMSLDDDSGISTHRLQDLEKLLWRWIRDMMTGMPGQAIWTARRSTYLKDC